MRLAFCALIFVLLRATAAPAATWHVAADAAAPGDGTPGSPFALIADAMAAAAAGDTVRLGPGTWSDTVPLTVYGLPRLALLVLKSGVTVVGAGRDATFLHAQPSAIYTFGIAAENVDGSAVVADLAVSGACFQGVNLRGASPRFVRLDLVNDVTGGSSVACDVRDRSFPVMTDILFAGGHTALVVEFGSAGTYTDCTLGVRPNDGLICNDGSPVMTGCTFLGAGRDVLVLTQGSRPLLSGCRVADGGSNAVRVALYPPGSTVDLAGNTWFSDDPAAVLARVRDARVDPALGATVLVEPLGDGGVPARHATFGGMKALYR